MQKKKFLLAIFLGFLILVIILELRLRPTIINFAEAQARWTATNAIHQAILENIATDVTYTDIIKIEKNSQQKVTFMQADVVKINRIQSEATLEVQKTMETLERKRVEFPLGQVLGSHLFAAYGPPVVLHMIPLGTVKVQVDDNFKATGINQTRHRVYLKIESDVKVVVPLASTKVTVKSEVPIADAIIVGEVPETYVLFEEGEGIIKRLQNLSD